MVCEFPLVLQLPCFLVAGNTGGYKVINLISLAVVCRNRVKVVYLCGWRYPPIAFHTLAEWGSCQFELS